MAEAEIKRVRFFDGQFLKQEEFQEEQYYHLHMRRRLNYILFNQSGVVLVTGNDLTLETDESNDNKNFTVKAGMAISKGNGLMEGKEIILRQDTTINLNDEGISTDQIAYITIHYEEKGAKDPPSEGDEDQDTRVKENAVIMAHPDNPPVGAADNGEEYIVLGTITYNTMATAETGRQLAQINHHLIGGAGAPGQETPTITGISEDSGVQGDTVLADITGTHLDGATDVTFNGLGGVTVPNLSVIDPQTIQISINIANNATPGSRTFTVTTPNGTASSAGIPAAAFSVLPAAAGPTVVSIDPAYGRQKAVNLPITIYGSNLSGVTGVNVLHNDGNPDNDIDVTIVNVPSNGNSLDATFTISENAAAEDLTNGRKIQVIPGGEASVENFFTVRKKPIIKSYDRYARPNDKIDIKGSNIRNEDPGQPATSTVIRFVEPGNPSNFQLGISPFVKGNISDNAGPHVIEVTVPPKGNLPNQVNLILEIDYAKYEATGPDEQFNFY